MSLAKRWCLLNKFLGRDENRPYYNEKNNCSNFGHMLFCLSKVAGLWWTVDNGNGIYQPVVSIVPNIKKLI